MSAIQSTCSVLICGDVCGKFNNLLKTVTKLNSSKGPFEAIYCVGNFFSDDFLSEWELLKSNKLLFPIPCYIFGPCKPEHSEIFSDFSESKLPSQVIYLGQSGIFSTASGLKVAYLSGIESIQCCEHTFTAKDVSKMQSDFHTLSLKGVDILLTSQWPKHMMKNLPSTENLICTQESELISYLATSLKPCYHFAGLTDVFYERIPYRNSQGVDGQASHNTKFVGLASVSNKQKLQFLYGVNRIPINETPENILRKNLFEISTECPYNLLVQDKVNISSGSTSNMFHSSESGSSTTSKGKNQQSKKACVSTQHSKELNCWFCLGSKVDEHLIFSSGCHCYLALPKGWLYEGHTLIIPHSHQRSSSELPHSVLNEVEDYMRALKKYYHSKNQLFVCFERSYKSPHMQFQVIGIPEVLENKLEPAFLETATSLNITLEEIPPLTIMKQIISNNNQYFYLEIEYKRHHFKKFVHFIEDDFPLDFARCVLAKPSLLNVPNRIDWRKCSLSFNEELHHCEMLQEEFQPFSPYKVDEPCQNGFK